MYYKYKEKYCLIITFYNIKKNYITRGLKIFPCFLYIFFFLFIYLTFFFFTFMRNRKKSKQKTTSKLILKRYLQLEESVYRARALRFIFPSPSV